MLPKFAPPMGKNLEILIATVRLLYQYLKAYHQCSIAYNQSTLQMLPNHWWSLLGYLQRGWQVLGFSHISAESNRGGIWRASVDLSGRVRRFQIPCQGACFVVLKRKNSRPQTRELQLTTFSIICDGKKGSKYGHWKGSIQKMISQSAEIVNYYRSIITKNHKKSKYLFENKQDPDVLLESLGNILSREDAICVKNDFS